MIAFYQKYFKQKLTLACFKENSDDIVALHVLSVWDGPHTFKNHSGSGMMNALKVVAYIYSQFDISSKYGEKQYIESCGLSVNPKYPIFDINVEMLKARIPLLKIFGFNLTSSLFSGFQLQKAAEKVGFTTDYEITYQELAEKGYPCQGATENSLKQMSLKL